MKSTLIKVYTENNDFQYIETLRRNRTRRHASREFFLEGVRAINQALKEGWKVNAWIYTRETRLSDWAAGILNNIPAPRHYELPFALLKKLSQKEDTSELLALAAMPPDDLERIPAARLVVVLDRPASPGNLGAIIRSCDALGADGAYDFEDLQWFELPVAAGRPGALHARDRPSDPPPHVVRDDRVPDVHLGPAAPLARRHGLDLDPARAEIGAVAVGQRELARTMHARSEIDDVGIAGPRHIGLRCISKQEQRLLPAVPLHGDPKGDLGGERDLDGVLAREQRQRLGLEAALAQGLGVGRPCFWNLGRLFGRGRLLGRRGLGCRVSSRKDRRQGRLGEAHGAPPGTQVTAPRASIR